MSRAFLSVLESGYFVLGPHVAAFEAAFADYCGTRYAVGVANGTEALEPRLRAMDVGRAPRTEPDRTRDEGDPESIDGTQAVHPRDDGVR